MWSVYENVFDDLVSETKNVFDDLVSETKTFVFDGGIGVSWLVSWLTIEIRLLTQFGIGKNLPNRIFNCIVKRRIFKILAKNFLLSGNIS